MARIRSFVRREPPQDNSAEVAVALRFFSLMASNPFLCLVKDGEAGVFRLFMKGEHEQVEELFEIIREEECGP